MRSVNVDFSRMAPPLLWGISQLLSPVSPHPLSLRAKIFLLSLNAFQKSILSDSLQLIPTSRFVSVYKIGALWGATGAKRCNVYLSWTRQRPRQTKVKDAIRISRKTVAPEKSHLGPAGGNRSKTKVAAKGTWCL